MIIKLDQQAVKVSLTQNHRHPKVYILDVVEITTGPESTVLVDEDKNTFVYDNTEIVQLEVIMPVMLA